MTVHPTDALSGIEPEEVTQEYDRRELETLSDAQLAATAARVVSMPLATATPAPSFVLHAPLELLARAGLLTYVAPSWRRAARVRIVSLVSGYERAGATLGQRHKVVDCTSVEAAGRLRAAIAAGDLDEVDRSAPYLGASSSAGEIRRLLTNDVLGSLAAAGHANIYLDLAVSTPSETWAAGLVWPMARELAKSPQRGLTTAIRFREQTDCGAASLPETLAVMPLVGPAPARGIAPMVEKAEAEGVVATILNEAGADLFGRPEEAGRHILRAAALMMLQGPPNHAPYGWTHCLTLSQAALAQAGAAADPAQATAVAVAYVAAHWSCLAQVPFDPQFVPEPVSTPLADALWAAPAVAARAVWHVPVAALAGVGEALATKAAAAHDAHHVKYTLACLRATTADPVARRLFLAAAAYLGAWWAQNPNRDDPLVGQPIGPTEPQPAHAAPVGQGRT